jgi:hypothetical protein
MADQRAILARSAKHYLLIGGFVFGQLFLIWHAARIVDSAINLSTQFLQDKSEAPQPSDPATQTTSNTDWALAQVEKFCANHGATITVDKDEVWWECGTTTVGSAIIISEASSRIYSKPHHFHL